MRAGERLWGIEACRGFAALLVVFVHSGMLNEQAVQSGELDFQINKMFQVGRTGVDFFFVLSGFIIYYVHKVDIGRPDRFFRYVGRRLTRLVPAYWIITGLFVVLTYFSPTADGREQELSVIVRSLLFIPQPDGPVVSVGWSLEHEMFFYIMFGIMILSRRIGIILWTIWLGAVAWRYLVEPIPHPFRYDWFGFQLEFFIGMIVAEIILRGWIKYSIIAIVIGVGGFIFGFYMDISHEYATNSLLGKVTFGLASGVLIYGVAGMDLYRRWTVPYVFRLVGDSTYSLYLIHGMILIILGEILQRLYIYGIIHEAGTMIVAIGAAVTGGVIFAQVVEKPAIGFMRHMLQSRIPALFKRKRVTGPT